MENEIIENALNVVSGYLNCNYNIKEIAVIREEINKIIGIPLKINSQQREIYSYEQTQELLSTLNEKESMRKTKGVYYTPLDVVQFILTNSVKMVFNELDSRNVNSLNIDCIPYDNFCYKTTIFDPTCGSGAFLLPTLELKFDLLISHNEDITAKRVRKVVETVNGNDLNIDSIKITKLRIFLCALYRFGVSKIKGLSDVLNKSYECYDYVECKPKETKYDVIIGNPPYVEDSKSESRPCPKYGNIYANVLHNATLQLKSGGVLGFVIPLSYAATPRMKKIREELFVKVPHQYILSYSDRPDCLFSSVHQKLCILFCQNKEGSKNFLTGNYKYWYKEERQDLFNTAEVVQNNYIEDSFIPKLGTKEDVSVYRKVVAFKTPIVELLEGGNVPIYLNMRASFWIKAFLKEHTGKEYKTFRCLNQEDASFCFCLLNSSLFWWYWVCVSDCWHITQKELFGFKVPLIADFTEVNRLGLILEKQLEETKVYVGTKQTNYEYKHKECVETIHRIDDVINKLYGLSEEEETYIKNFAFRYRIGGGADVERN